MTSISDIRTALAATIQAGVADTLYAYGSVTESVVLPAVVVEPASADFVTTFNRGQDQYDFNLFVLVSRADPASAQPVLDALVSGVGPDSIRRAIYDKSNLGLGDSVEATVHSMVGYGGSLESYGEPHIGAVIRVCVHVGNS